MRTTLITLRTLAMGGLLLAQLGSAAGAMAAPAPAADLRSTALAAFPSSVLADYPPDTPDNDLPVGVAWGYNLYGRLGDGTQTTRLAPVLVNGDSTLGGIEVNSISNGRTHACGLAAGDVYCWGWGVHGELGDGDVQSRTAPVLVAGLLADKQVTAVSVGDQFSCALAEAQAYCWGDNTYGQLGTGPFHKENSILPAWVSGLSGRKVSSIDAGAFHACAVADGKAFCWGHNDSGQIGNGVTGDPEYAVSPVTTTGVLKGRTVTSVSAGWDDTCATADGQAFCWGYNGRGQLGNNSIMPSSVPVSVYPAGVLANATVDSVAAGSAATCAVATKSTIRQVYCWGRNASGELGNGTNTESHVPVLVILPPALAKVSVATVSGEDGTNCLLVTGKVYCWGSNVFGRFGTGNEDGSTVPLAPASSTGVLSDRQMLSLSAHGYTTGVAASLPSYPDVPAAYPFVDDIGWLAGSGITQGYDDGSFKPTANTQRQAMAAFVFRFTNPGVPLPKCAAGTRKYLDVPASNIFCGAVEWLVANGIATVPADQKFRPVVETTRGVMASWIYRAWHPGVADQVCTGVTFSDVPPGSDNCGNIEWLARVGVANGYEDGTFKPTASVHRDAMAAFLHRARDLSTH
ncbi:hypothetical protein D1871_12490 [Nakamurella silvestris]|nr:hypothetical protein D1871_12490 [Nakamurella silvestris]